MLLFGGMVTVLHSALFTTANLFLFLRNSFSLCKKHLKEAYHGVFKSEVCKNLSPCSFLQLSMIMLRILVPRSIGMLLWYWLSGTTRKIPACSCLRSGRRIIASMYPSYGRDWPSALSIWRSWFSGMTGRCSKYCWWKLWLMVETVEPVSKSPLLSIPSKVMVHSEG